jgi:hypothetical protein
MTDITYDRVAATPASVSADKTVREGFWRRAFAAMVEARMRQAERIVKEYQELAKRR